MTERSEYVEFRGRRWLVAVADRDDDVNGGHWHLTLTAGSAGPSPAVRSEGGADDATAGVPRPPSDAPDMARVTVTNNQAFALAEATELLRDLEPYLPSTPAHRESNGMCSYCWHVYDWHHAWPCPVERARRFLTRTEQPQ